MATVLCRWQLVAFVAMDKSPAELRRRTSTAVRCIGTANTVPGLDSRTLDRLAVVVVVVVADNSHVAVAPWDNRWMVVVHYLHHRRHRARIHRTRGMMVHDDRVNRPPVPVGEGPVATKDT